MKLNPEKEIHRACREALDTAHRKLLDPFEWLFPPHWLALLGDVQKLYELPVKKTNEGATLRCLHRHGPDCSTQRIRVVGCAGPRFCDVCKRIWPDDGSGPGEACPLCRPKEHPEEALTQEVQRCWELLLS